MKWFRQFWDPRNPVQKFDRYQSNRPIRWVCGLSIDDNFGHLRACLLKSSGAGKLLQLVPAEFHSTEIPASQRKLLQNFAQPFTELNSTDLTENPNETESRCMLPSVVRSDGSLEDYFSIRDDLTSLAVGLISQIQSQAGPAGEEILASAIYHSGLFCLQEPENWSSFKLLPLFDSNQLAHRTGLNILDQLPSRQIADGGSPWPLSALPLWMLCADRSTPVAVKNRMVVELGDWIHLTFLPPSDGYDGDFPKIHQLTLPGLNLFSKWLPQETDPNTDVAHLAAQGRCDQVLMGQFEFQMEEYRRSVRFNRSSLGPLAEFFQGIQSSVDESRSCLPDLLQSYANFVTKSAIQFSEESLAMCQVTTDSDDETSMKSKDEPQQWFLAGDSSFGSLISSLGANLDSTIEFQEVSRHSCPSNCLSAVVSATLGFFHIDQLPSSLPWVAGCQSPRILGSLTPGSPGRWRKLLLEMSDYRPPVMKLRDAV